MKIIAWNCNMAFRKKAAIILALKPDILVIPECEHPDKLLFPPGTPTPTDMLWFGKNLHKGLGIFSFSEFRFSVCSIHNEDFKMIVPVTVTGGPFDFTLFAVWANNPGDPDGQYVTQTWKALHHYDELLTSSLAVLAGDFNSNTIWDRKHRRGNHTDVVNLLAKKNIFSAYHLHHKQTQGTEEHPTHYLYRHQNKPYHLDYCFASSEMLASLASVEIGDYDYWSKYSNHVPVIATFNSSNLPEQTS